MRARALDSTPHVLLWHGFLHPSPSPRSSAHPPLRYGPALKHIAEIIERGVREPPELSVGSQTEGVDVRSVGNSMVLEETALVEAFNLKAAIEFQMKNFDAAKEVTRSLHHHHRRRRHHRHHVYR